MTDILIWGGCAIVGGLIAIICIATQNSRDAEDIRDSQPSEQSSPDPH